MIPLSINHFIKTCTPQYRVCPDHSILLIQGEAPVILWPKVPAIVLYLLYGMLVLTPLPPCEVTSEACLRGWPLADQALPVFPSLSAHRPFISAAPRAQLFILSDSD